MPKLKSKKVKTKSDAAVAAESREVVYPDHASIVCEGETAITAEDARVTLGWEEVPEGGGEYVREIYSLAKIRVRLTNNVINRPIYTAGVLTLKQEILRKRWRMNGEPIIIGKTGLLLNGQHTLIALVLADLEWQQNEDWRAYWPTAPSIDKVVTSGVSEDDETVNTMDTCKPRSLADVLYRTAYFSTMPGGQRRNAARTVDYAIRMMWHRTGAGHDAFAPRRTHAESLAFLTSHPKLLDCAKHIQEEDGKESKLSIYMPSGYAVGLLYLMGSSASDPEAYRRADHPHESMLDWSQWNDACDFWVLLAAGGDKVAAVRKAMARSIEDGGLSMAERWAIVTNAWLAYQDASPITQESLELQYETNDSGARKLLFHPSVGGIDLGDPSTADEDAVVANDPAPEEVAERSAATKHKSKASKAEPVKPKPTKLGEPRRAGANWRKNDVAWVADPDGDHYLGQLTEDPWDCDDQSCLAMVRDAKGDEWQVSYSSLSLERPANADKPSVHFPKPKPSSSKQEPEHKVGDLRWVRDKVGENWRGRIVAIEGGRATLKVAQGFRGAGNQQTVWLKALSKDQPT